MPWVTERERERERESVCFLDCIACVFESLIPSILSGKCPFGRPFPLCLITRVGVDLKYIKVAGLPLLAAWLARRV